MPSLDEARAMLTEEQVALRRVATLVAEAAPPAEIFSAVSNEVATLFRTELVVVGKFDGDPAELLVVGVGEDADEPVVGSRWKLDDALASAAVYRTGLPARLDRHSTIADPDVAGIMERFSPTATVAVPIKVEGGIWGAMIVSTRDALLPTDTEERLQRFTDLIATALANAEARTEVERLAEEQAALRRVATLVAQGAPPYESSEPPPRRSTRVFTLSPETSDVASVVRFDPGPEFVLVGSSKSIEGIPLESRWQPKDLYASTRVSRTGRSARVDPQELDPTDNADAEALRRQRLLSQVGSPIVVDGRLWGAMTINAYEELPADTEERLEKFTELAATAIANSDSRGAIARLANEQAALRRVATLVARDAASTEVFEAVATEAGKLLDADVTVVGRYNGDGSATAIGSWSASPGGVPVGTRSAIGGHNVLTIVAETGKPARVDGYEDASGEAAEIARRFGWRSSIAAPIVVEDRLWGVMLVATQRSELFPAGVRGEAGRIHGPARDCTREHGGATRAGARCCRSGRPAPRGDACRERRQTRTGFRCRGRRGPGCSARACRASCGSKTTERRQHWRRTAGGRPQEHATFTRSIRTSSRARFAGLDVQRGSRRTTRPP